MVFEKLSERLIIKGEIITQTPLHIGSGKKDTGISEVTPVITDLSGQPYIPGSSIKGKVRSEAERIARQNNLGACNPPHVEDMCGTLKRSPGEFCICCKIFGTAASSKGVSVASKVKFRDSYPIEKSETVLLTRAGIALDRSTGSVSRGAVFQNEAVSAGIRFSLEMVCDNMEEKEMNLLRAALKSVQESALGGFSSRGYGKVKFKIQSVTKRTAGYYLGEEQEPQKGVEDNELNNWQKDLEME
jgi:CRISPR-associated protein Csm3